MKNNKNYISVFEHESVRFDKGEKRISEVQFKALETYFGDKGVPYYSLIHNGVCFNKYVGVIQIGKFVINVLPKADKNSTSGEEEKWLRILIGMMRAVGVFEIKSTSESSLKIKPNALLDLYFEMFIKEVEYLHRNGLVKKYRKKEGNVTALKGSLQFSEHIQKNLTHQERFYVAHTTYDIEHKLHFILFKTIRLLKQINTSAGLNSRIGNLLLNFPEMPDIKVTEATFEKLVLNRKTLHYKKAIEIAKLLLLQYHPDLSTGRNHVLALMFDMNKLWEKFVFVSLRKNIDVETKITAQTSKYFWKHENGIRSQIRPDIVVNKGKENCIVFDTKWKNIYNNNPSPEDLRQMYVYHEYYAAKKVALVYPGENSTKRGNYFNKETTQIDSKECSIIVISAENDIKSWQKNIKKQLLEWSNT